MERGGVGRVVGALDEKGSKSSAQGYRRVHWQWWGAWDAGVKAKTKGPQLL